MRPGTLLRLALAGSRVDTLRIVLTALSTALATLAVLTAANVVAIGRLSLHGTGSDEWAEQYSNALLREPGLRPGVVLTLLLMTIPVFALAGQCTRLGAPARDRRLAAFRLAGATPLQTVAVASAETGVAALAGSLAGLGVYLAGHRLLHRPDAEGKLPLPTDVFPQPWFTAVAVAAIPLLAALAAAIVMRRVTVSPFGVVRRVRRARGPRPWAGVFIVAGVALIAGVASESKLRAHLKYPAPPDWLLPVLLLAGVAAAGFGVVIGTGWLTYTAGRLLGRGARRPATLLASARLTADPWSGSRTLAVLLICVLFGAGAAGVRAQFAALAEVERAELRLENPGIEPQGGLADPFYLRTMDLIDAAVYCAIALTAIAMLIVVAEGIVTRRREYAALVAAGVPRGTLGRAILWQSLLPAVPAVLVALAVGLSVARTFGAEVSAGGGTMTTCTASAEICGASGPDTDPEHWTTVVEPLIVRPVGIPWLELSRAGGVALLAVLATTAVGLLFLRRSTDLEEIRVT
ncbi:FtsX-like permease family protein [Dactylosporangium sp. CA-092794]|uniref:FtsX-like permease family protein n=1 Tax=Dactylosporangium sp. CA-092794 TaxID=3239929 RepID=UPI003D8C3127